MAMLNNQMVLYTRFFLLYTSDHAKKGHLQCFMMAWQLASWHARDAEAPTTGICSEISVYSYGYLWVISILK